MKPRFTWPTGELLIEAIRNVTAFRSRAAVTVLIAVIIGGLAGLWLAQGTERFVREAAAEALSGTQVVTVGSDTDLRGPLLSRASCESLSAGPLVIASGTYHISSYQWFPQLGDVAVVEASPTLVDFYGGDMVLGAGLPASGSAPAGHLVNARGDAYSYTVAPPQPVGIELNRSVVFGAPPSAQTRTCVVRLHTGVEVEAVLPLLMTQLAYEGEGVPAVFAKPGSGEAARRFLASPDRVALVLSCLVFGACVGLSRRLRVSEAISYRLAGTTPAQLAVIQGCEDLLCGALASAAAMAVLGTAAPGDPRVLLAQALWACACGCAYAWGLFTSGLLVVLARPTRLALV